MRVSFLFCVSLLLLLLACQENPRPNSTSARTTNFDGKIEGRKLQWSDFQGTPDPSSSYDAFTQWNIFYQYDAPTFKSDRTLVEVNVWVELDKKSWVKENPKVDKAELLNHEQGHYDIALICAQTLRDAFTENKYSKDNYHYKVDSIYHEVLHYFLQLERQYDFETNHLFDKKKQGIWDEFFEKELGD